MKTLLPMSDFVLEQKNKVEASTYERANSIMVIAAANIFNYAQFINQHLEKWMFVPCDEDGNVLEQPKEKVFSRENGAYEFDEYCKIYEKAKEKVLFEGFEAKNYLNLVGLKHKTWDSWYMGFYKTVEDLSGQEVELTPTALKQIGL